MKFWYDTEFLDNGRTIDLISIGIVAEDGREYYAVNRDAPWRKVRKHPWLMANVVPHLPKPSGDWNLHMPTSWLFNYRDHRVKGASAIGTEVRAFLLSTKDPVELWGYYSAYDHVVLAQLWGPMSVLPKGIPMWTNDIQQVAHELGLDACLPAQTGNAHNALDDARWVRDAWVYLDGQRRSTASPNRQE